MITRSQFVGTAAGAALAGSARAQTPAAQLAPVAEDDPAITVAGVHLDRSGFALPAYAALPKNAGGATPGVVVVQHIWGVDESIRDTVRRFAAAGFAAIAPELFARDKPPDGDNATDFNEFRPYAQKLNDDVVDGDLRAGALWLRAQHADGNAGVTGFCMGGGIALRQTIASDVFAAGVVFYGRVEGLDPKSVRVPLRGNYGQDDKSIPAADVRAFFEALRVPHELDIYPNAGHAFFDRTRSSWSAAAAEDAWPKTLAFFAKYLTR